MNDQMPMFDDPIRPAEPPPKKPRQKPMRRKAKKAVEKPKRAKKFRKRRTIKPTEPHKNYHTPEAYRLIGTLMNLDIPLRNFVMEVTKALTK